MGKTPMEETLARLQKKVKTTKTGLLSAGSASDVLGVIPTGIGVLDHYVLGSGGLPAGRIMEVYSDEGVGKTSFLMHCMAKTQALGGIVALAETEAKLSSQRAAVFGCDLDQIIFAEPANIDEACLWIQEVLNSLPDATADSPPHFIGWDSIAATQTTGEMTEGIETKSKVGERAKLMSKFMRILPKLAVAKKAHIFLVNQTRDNIGVMFGDKKTTPGGGGTKFASTLRLQLFGGKAEKEEGEHVGKTITFKAAKNQVSVPNRLGRVKLFYATGFDDEWATIFYAKEKGVVPKAAKYSTATYESARKKLGWAE